MFQNSNLQRHRRGMTCVQVEEPPRAFAFRGKDLEEETFGPTGGGFLGGLLGLVRVSCYGLLGLLGLVLGLRLSDLCHCLVGLVALHVCLVGWMIDDHSLPHSLHIFCSSS